ncbi:MAG TPA: glycoside hydrolase family 78 protein [Acidobacteriota bacterium]|jgi:alpha-L-rhamnosidase|nr:glycoside hydrolase family 78 protein [Acidobacteriota bacterium]HRV09291.1 glycoside hydrolase family 78 protein [Acidobacteriota bacterium]
MNRTRSALVTTASLVLLLSAAPFLPAAFQVQAAVLPQQLLCEYLEHPLGIDVQPRFSWRLTGDRFGVSQNAYQLQVFKEGESNPLWDSGRVQASDSHLVAYAGPALQSMQRYRWRVKVWDERGNASEWSSEAWFETGLLQPSTEWQAEWISAPWGRDGEEAPSPYFRRAFSTQKQIRRARLYITSLGLYRAEINGRPVTSDVFTPGWTSYHKRLQYQTYDVTVLLEEGENALGIYLGDGWYRGYLAWAGRRNVYGKRLAVSAMLRIEYSDGKLTTVATDSSWRCREGAIRTSDIYMGEVYDARLEMPGWSTASFDDADWKAVETLDPPQARLVAPVSPPVRRVEEIRPRAIIQTPAGETVVDMGQNMVGWLRIRVRGQAGDRVEIQHAEVLDKEGNFYTENLRSAKQTDTYILRGEGEEIWEPHFTFHGFRYVKIIQWPGTPAPDAITGLVVHSALPVTGSFQCSDPEINQLQHNIVWGQKGNFLDVPTDCPQRDERLGWTGDAQVFFSTAALNMNVAGFFHKWLADLAVDQLEDGRITHVVPNVLGDGAGSVGWADAGVIIPWELYLRYGDHRILEAQYDSMRRWVDYMARQVGEDYLWTTGFHFGDWLSATYNDPSFPAAVTDKDFLATAFLAHSADLLAKTAEVLGRKDDGRRYRQLFESVQAAFQREFMTPTGRLSPNSQTAYAVALRFGLIPEGLRQAAVDRLVQDIRARDNHLSTGFLGTPHLLHVLSENGRLDAAYTLLFQDTYPSWLYPVKRGATTIWERWDGIRPDGTFQDPGMNSFNHYAYGAVGQWLYENVAGIRPDPDGPGYRRFVLAPEPGGKLTWAEATLDSPYGNIRSRWERRGNQLVLEFRVPPNSRARAVLPESGPRTLEAIRNQLAGMLPENAVRLEAGKVVVDLRPGEFRLQYPVTAPQLE